MFSSFILVSNRGRSFYGVLNYFFGSKEGAGRKRREYLFEALEYL